VAPIVVEPETLAGAGVSISAVGDELATALNTLAAELPNGAMAGHDRAGLAFGQAYRQEGQALMNAGAAAVSGGRKVGFGVQMSATNYSRADASSTIGGGASALTPPTAPGEFDAPSVPSPFGGGVAEPFLWSMVEMLVGDVWPNGDPEQLRAAASAWSSFASTLSGIGTQLEGSSATISGQQIPEGGEMATALSDLKQGLSDITTESVRLATQTFEFAADVEAAQNAIRDLLSRLSPSGIFDGLGAIFSGDAMEELREIADDIRTVLDNLKRQADARQQSMQDVMQMIDHAVVSLEQKARKEFTHYLGDDVGNAAATVFDTSLNMREGIIKGGIGALEDLQQLNPLRFAYDFEGAKDTWGGMLETNFNASVVGQIIDPERATQTQKEILKGLVHAEDWTTERPGLGLGENIFDVGSAFVGGAGVARTGTRAAGEAADAAEGAAPGVRAAGALDNAVTDTSAIAGRAGSIADKLDNLADNIPKGATPNASGPAVPPSLTEPPSAPRVPETPGSRVPDAQTPHTPGSPTPHVPDSTPVDRSPTAPHSSTPTSTPTHAPAGPGDAPRTGTPPIGALPESRVPAAVDAPPAPHQTAPAPSESSAPASVEPPVASHTPAAQADQTPLSSSPEPSAKSPSAERHGPSDPAPAIEPSHPTGEHDRGHKSPPGESAHPSHENDSAPSSSPDGQVSPLPEPSFDINTDHARQLGNDPDIGGSFRPAEAETGLRVEWERSISLERARADVPGDWIDVATGKSYDAVGNFPAKYFDSQWENLQAQIIDHLKKADYVPIDVSKFSAEQRLLVQNFVDNLGNDRAFIVGEGYGG
jgi:hypothetical protein